MKNKITKISCSVGVGIHLFFLSTIFMVGESILFGIRFFDAMILSGGVITLGGIGVLIYISALNSLKKPMRGIACTFNIPDRNDQY